MGESEMEKRKRKEKSTRERERNRNAERKMGWKKGMDKEREVFKFANLLFHIIPPPLGFSRKD